LLNENYRLSQNIFQLTMLKPSYIYVILALTRE
jgi:hypothetical protein